MGKIAFVFTGQGAQCVGMGKDLYDNFYIARSIFDMLPKKLLDLMFYGPEKELFKTINTQPCLFAMDLACAKLLNENGIFADCVGGFSLGEIPAVCYSGIMNEQEAFDFVCLRASAMARCADENEGVMLAVLKIPAIEVINICKNIKEAYPVNFNCPGQTVVACRKEAIKELESIISSKGGKAIKLAVSGAFHSPFMENASVEIRKYLSQKIFGEMEVPIYSNVTANVYSNPAEMLALQVKSPVMWQKTIENIIADGIDTFIEVGAGKTLSGLIKKIDGAVKILNVCDTASLKLTLSEVQNA